MAEKQDFKDRIQALPPLRQLVDSMNLRARKSLGQNFLFDLSLTRQIARSSGSLSGTTIEVGPGPGGLTRALLLEGATHVIAIEKDRRGMFELVEIGGPDPLARNTFNWATYQNQKA